MVASETRRNGVEVADFGFYGNKQLHNDTICNDNNNTFFIFLAPGTVAGVVTTAFTIIISHITTLICTCLISVTYVCMYVHAVECISCIVIITIFFQLIILITSCY